MYEVRIDKAKNRLLFKISGLPTNEETESAGVQLLERAKELRPGFGVINDISDSRPLSQEQLAVVRKVTAGLVQLGLKHMVRVVGGSAIAARQYQREGVDPSKFGGENVASYAEAEAILDAAGC